MWPFFSTKSAPVVETKASISVPDEELLAVFGIITADGGVSSTQALTVPAVAAAVRVISEAASTLRVHVKRKVDTQLVVDEEHPVAKLLSGSVNSWTSGFELIRDLTAQALTHDAGGLAWVNRVSGKVREVIRYRPGVITVQYDINTNEPSYYLSGLLVDSRNILHLRGPFDKCPVTLARVAIGAAYSMEAHASSLFRNSARPGGVIETPKPVGDTGIKAMIKAWRAAHDGPANVGKTAILWDGATWKQMQISSTDAQFLENRKFQILEIARAFRVSPTLLFDFDRATWSNGETSGREFLVYTLEPWLRALETCLERALLTNEERKTHRICFERDDLTRADLSVRATAYSSLIQARVINPNTAREWEGLAPYPEGETYANPAITVSPANSNINSNPKKEAA